MATLGHHTLGLFLPVVYSSTTLDLPIRKHVLNSRLLTLAGALYEFFHIH